MKCLKDELCVPHSFTSFRIYDRRRTVSFFIKLHLYFVLVIRILLFLFSCGQKIFFCPKLNGLGTRGSWWLRIWNSKSVLLQVLAKKRIVVSMGESTFREYHQGYWQYVQWMKQAETRKRKRTYWLTCVWLKNCGKEKLLNISITTRKRLLVKEQNEWIAKCSSICYTWRRTVK